MRRHGTVKLAEVGLGRSRVGRLKEPDDDGPDWPVLGRSAEGALAMVRTPAPGELYRYHLDRLAWRSRSPDVIQVIPPEWRAPGVAKFAADSALERGGFELLVPLPRVSLHGGLGWSLMERVWRSYQSSRSPGPPRCTKRVSCQDNLNSHFVFCETKCSARLSWGLA